VAALREQRRQRRYLVRALLRSPTFMVGLIIVLIWVFMGLFSTYFTQSPTDVDVTAVLQAPGSAHWFGADDLGRDVFARTMAGARTVLVIAPLATLIALLWGGIIGLVAGFYRGTTDEIIMRLVDVLLALPIIITSILILSLLGKSLAIVIVVIGALFTPVVSRTIRSAVIGEREREYVMAARLRGERSAFVMAREILPNITQPIIVEGTIRLGYAVFTAATLSFLGFGLQPPSPDWGLTIATERVFLQIAPWTVIFPALALASLVVGVNLITDGLGRVFSK
jgi:peptide/nickel transport system permease protein